MRHYGWYEWRLKAKLFNRELWKKRNEFAKALEAFEFRVKEFDNPFRLHAYRGDEEFIIDCQQDNKSFRTKFTPVKWVYGKTDKPVIITDIPDSGKHGIWNDDSEYGRAVDALVLSVYGYRNRGRR